MTEIRAFLETAQDGRTMAHVLDLPGCFASGESKDQALVGILGALDEHVSWLRSHDHNSPEPPFRITVAEEVYGSGPFDPGDPAAFFAKENEPLNRRDLLEWLRIATDSRADFLDLVSNLTADFLDRAEPGSSFTIRRILRHVGDAEEGYISKLVSFDRLPAEWLDDEKLGPLEYLDMERASGFALIKSLSDEERAKTFNRPKRDGVTLERWSIRKVIRRLIEHEREHTRQIREILA